MSLKILIFLSHDHKNVRKGPITLDCWYISRWDSHHIRLRTATMVGWLQRLRKVLLDGRINQGSEGLSGQLWSPPMSKTCSFFCSWCVIHHFRVSLCQLSLLIKQPAQTCPPDHPSNQRPFWHLIKLTTNWIDKVYTQPNVILFITSITSDNTCESFMYFKIFKYSI